MLKELANEIIETLNESEAEDIRYLKRKDIKYGRIITNIKQA